MPHPAASRDELSPQARALCERATEIRRLEGVGALLAWDQRTHLPPAGAADRAAQAVLLASLLHERVADPRLGELAEAVAEQEGDPVLRAGARNILRRHRRAARVPADLVRALSAATSRGYSTWVKAREEGAWSSFSPALAEILRLTRETAEAWRTPEHAHLYDALLEGYDPGVTVAWLDPLFDRLVEGIRAFLDRLDPAAGPDPLSLSLPIEAQERLSRIVLKAMGYPEDAGRMDLSAHPFTIRIGRGDVRLTTRFREDDLLDGLTGTIHEGGHALYELGIPPELDGTGCDHAASYGLHESQSRFWENIIGRSLPFCRWLAPRIEQVGGPRLGPEALHGASNRVSPGPIRVTADEVTYNLHIALRYRLEKAMIVGDLPVDDLPAAWDEGMEELLGLRPGSLAEGVLQDVHWSSGAIGYFPSYTLGNLYAASLAAAMEDDLPGLWEAVEAGTFEVPLGWLRERVHALGHSVEAPEIVRRAAGERDHVADLLAHFERRHGALYGLA